MLRIVSTMSVLAAAGLALSGCNANLTLNSTATTEMRDALAVGCPVLAAVKSLNLSLDTYQQAAVNTLALVCPPNPPPTSALVAVEDIIAAYATLQPLLK